MSESEGAAHDTETPQIIGDMLELWPGEWVKASAIATVAALPTAPLVVEGEQSGTVDFTEEVERRRRAAPAPSPTPGPPPDSGPGPEPGCRVHLVGETGGKRCAYPVAVVLQTLATISGGTR